MKSYSKSSHSPAQEHFLKVDENYLIPKFQEILTERLLSLGLCGVFSSHWSTNMECLAFGIWTSTRDIFLFFLHIITLNLYDNFWSFSK